MMMGMIGFIKGARVVSAPDSSSLEIHFRQALQSRHTASTKMNDRSSRSHLVVGLIVETTSKVNGTVLRGKVMIGPKNSFFLPWQSSPTCQLPLRPYPKLSSISFLPLLSLPTRRIWFEESLRRTLLITAHNSFPDQSCWFGRKWTNGQVGRVGQYVEGG